MIKLDMFWPLPKSLLALALAGTGVTVPLVATASSSADVSSTVTSESAEAEGEVKAGKRSRRDAGEGQVEQVKNQETLTTEQRRDREALREVDEKNCKQVLNPKFQGSWFGNLLVCKNGEKNQEGNAKTVFYFLDKGTSNSVRSQERGRGLNSLVKKVVSISYVENKGEKKAYLSLKLGEKGEENRSLEVEVGSVWKNFKDVNPSEKCSLETMVLGGDNLKCELTVSSEFGGKPFQYLFQVT